MERRPLPICVDDLVYALTAREGRVLGSYLDLRTGRVFQLTDPALTGEDNEHIESAMDQEPARYARVPLYTREYRLMCAWADAVEDDELAIRLDAALRGAGAFRGFTDELDSRPAAASAWAAHREAALLRWAHHWLHGLGVEPTWDRPVADTAGPSEAPSPGVLEILALGVAGGAGAVSRTLTLADEATARSVYRRAAEQLCELHGVPVPRRAAQSSGQVRHGSARVELQGRSVTVELDIDGELLEALSQVR